MKSFKSFHGFNDLNDFNGFIEYRVYGVADEYRYSRDKSGNDAFVRGAW